MTHDKEKRTSEEDVPREALEAGAYVDGAMDDDPLEKQVFEQRLTGDAGLQERVAAYRHQSEHLQDAFQPLLHVPAPADFYCRLQDGTGRSRPLRSIAAAVALTVAGAGAGWGGASYLQTNSPAPMHAVLDALRHEDMLATLLTVPESNGGGMPLAAGFGDVLPAGRIEASGLTEIERSMKIVDGRPALVVDYRTPAGDAVTLMAQQRANPSANRPATQVQKDGISASIWTGDTTVYTLISPTESNTDLGTLTARIRGDYRQEPTPIPRPLLRAPEPPLARDMPRDPMVSGPGDIQLSPGMGGPVPGESLPKGPPASTLQGPLEGQSL